ncbi:unnamed protein product [Effrenium voratum]|nr:unnamed protein product [Effrenium voratum]
MCRDDLRRQRGQRAANCIQKARAGRTSWLVLGDHVLVETHLCHGADLQAHDGRSEVTVSLCFTSREPPAAVNAIYDSRYHGNVKDDVKECFISFPGKFASGWDVLNAAKVWRAFSCKLPKFVSKTCRRR